MVPSEGTEVARRQVPAPVAPRPLDAAALLAGESSFHWLVAAPDGGAVCRPFANHRYTREGTGVLEPGPSPDAGARLEVDPWRRISFGYRKEGDSLVLDEPRVEVGRGLTQRALVMTCQQAVLLAELRWFASGADCARASRATDPVDLGACAGAIDTIAEGRFGSPGLARLFASGGSIHALEPDHDRGGQQCVTWTIRPGKYEALMTARYRTEHTLYEVTNEVTGADTEVLHLRGRGGRVIRHDGPGGVGIGTLGCGLTLLVRQPAADHATVGGERWFFERRGCEQALRGRLLASLGGC